MYTKKLDVGPQTYYEMTRRRTEMDAHIVLLSSLSCSYDHDRQLPRMNLMNCQQNLGVHQTPPPRKTVLRPPQSP